jgi:hypothetical protein
MPAYIQLLALSLFWLSQINAQAQSSHVEKYFLTLAEKDSTLCSKIWVSPKTIAQRKAAGLPIFQYSDVPVNQRWIDSIKVMGINIVSVSRWLNGVSVWLNQEQLYQIAGKHYVQRVEKIQKLHVAVKGPNKDSIKLHDALHQIGSIYLQKEQLSGKGVSIGLIDAGFKNANEYKPTKHLVKSGQVIATRDWITPGNENFFSFPKDLDNHGTLVLSLVGGLDVEKQKQYGLAYNAQFFLCRTDHDVRENRVEMDYWVAALEWLDSCGVRLVNSSLGYATDFDDPAENFAPEQMDGKTSIVARASDIAYLEKGMLIIVSAGNDGDNIHWRYIATPADAQYNIAVGATDMEFGMRAAYSGIGPAFLPYVKPDVACFAADGTSFSAPIITGLAACLWERYPFATNKIIREALLESAHLYPYVNNYIGYGIPNVKVALDKMHCKVSRICTVPNKKVKFAGQSYIINTPNGVSQLLRVFHKSDETQVTAQEVLYIKGKHTLKPPTGTKFSTLILSNAIDELQWHSK